MILVLIVGFFSVVRASPLPLGNLDGVWTQRCSGFHQASEHFYGNQVALEEVSHSKSNCQSPTLKIRSEGAYVVERMAAVPEDGWEMTFVFNAVKIQVVEEATIQRFRSRQMCGISEWELGKWVELTALRCDFWQTGNPINIPNAQDLRFGIIKRERDEIFFGKLTPERNALSPFARPLEWNPQPFRRN